MPNIIRLSSAVVIALSIAVTACGSAPSTEGEPGAAIPADITVLTSAEIEQRSLNDRTLLDIVRQLRSNWLTFHGKSGTSSTAGQVQVSFESSTLSTLDDLQRMNGKDVIELRYLSASSAAQRFGTNARNGPVIVVKRR